MKKYLLTLLALFVVLAPNVKADELQSNIQDNKFVVNSYNSSSVGEEFPDFKSKVDFFNLEYNRLIYLELYKDIMNLYNSTYKSEYSYYQIDYSYTSDSYGLYMYLYSTVPSLKVEKSVSDYFMILPRETVTLNTYYTISSQTYTKAYKTSMSYGSNVSQNVMNIYRFYDLILTTNFDLKFSSSDNEIDTFVFNNFRDKGTLTLKIGDTFPQFYAYDKVFDRLDTSTTTTVNLDNYEYVILNLKDYNQDKAFNTNLKVKGMIGITPVYNFGQTEKDVITDRCNLSYEGYTDYRFSILKQDLQNDAVYIVKSCEEGSSFKFDNTIFDVTYVTADNVDDPVVTIGGKDYHTIPFKNLTNSANKNEENNFVPGESGFSLTDVISNISKYVSSFWDSIVNFMGLVTKFFNTLPIEIKGVAITTFSMACMIALIKFLKS